MTLVDYAIIMNSAVLIVCMVSLYTMHLRLAAAQEVIAQRDAEIAILGAIPHLYGEETSSC